MHIVGINGIKTESTISGINIDGQEILDSIINKDSSAKPIPIVQRATVWKHDQKWETGKVLLYSINGDLREWPDLISLKIAVDSDFEGLDQVPEENTPYKNAYLKIYTHDMRLIAFHPVDKVHKRVDGSPTSEIDVSVNQSVGDCPAADRTVDATPYIYELTGVLFN